MDDVAVSLVEIWNNIAQAVGADTLTVRETARNGYILALIGFAISTGGFFVIFPFPGDE
jgi:hypothetical protein